MLKLLKTRAVLGCSPSSHTCKKTAKTFRCYSAPRESSQGLSSLAPLACSALGAVVQNGRGLSAFFLPFFVSSLDVVSFSSVIIFTSSLSTPSSPNPDRQSLTPCERLLHFITSMSRVAVFTFTGAYSEGMSSRNSPTELGTRL